jgi:hypothetical protein
MRKSSGFRDAYEYESFMAWALEGSSLAQRMNTGPGTDEPVIPKYWEVWKPFADVLPFKYEDFLAGKIRDGKKLT